MAYLTLAPLPAMRPTAFGAPLANAASTEDMISVRGGVRRQDGNLWLQIMRRFSYGDEKSGVTDEDR